MFVVARSRTIDEFTKPTGTIIGKGFTIQAAKFGCGDNESMRVDGTVLGNVEIDGVINISDSGYIDGDIIAGSVRVAGRVNGNIHCGYALHLASTADVRGDISAEVLIVDEGAIIVGSCQTLDALDAIDAIDDGRLQPKLTYV